jgi:hypothetical protein
MDRLGVLFSFCFLSVFFLKNSVVWDACDVSRWNVAGTMTLADGRKYVGEFKDGKQHGQGMSCARGDES